MGDRWPERPGGRQRDDTTSWKVVARPRTGTSERVWQPQVPVEPTTAAGQWPDAAGDYGYPTSGRPVSSYPVSSYPASGYPAGNRPVSGYANGAYPGTYQVDQDRTAYQPTYRPTDDATSGDQGYGYEGYGYEAETGYGANGYVGGHPATDYRDYSGYQDQQTSQFGRSGYPVDTNPASGPAYPTSPYPAPPTSAPAYRAGTDYPPRTYQRGSTGAYRGEEADDDRESRRRSPRTRSGLPEPVAAWPPVMAWTVGCFVVPLLLYLVWAWTRSGVVPETCLDLGEPCVAPRAAALSTFVDVLPGVAAAVALSLLAALGLRRLSDTWRPITVGLGGAIIGAGFATLIASVLS